MTNSNESNPEHRTLASRKQFFRPFVESAIVKSRRKVPVTPYVAAVIENTELPTSGPASVWHYDREEDCVLAAEYQMHNESRYHPPGPTAKIMNRSIDDGFAAGDSAGYIRPDNEWHQTITATMGRDIFQEHFQLVWVVCDWMYQTEPRRAYLFTMNQFISQIPDDIVSGFSFTGIPDEETISEIIRNHGEEIITPPE